MKKLTAGILTVMLGVVAANSANAAIPSTAYVDAKAKTNADAIALKANAADVYTQTAADAKFETITNVNAVKATADAALPKTDFESFKTENTAAIEAKQNILTTSDFVKSGTGNVVSGFSVDADGKITYTTEAVATSENLNALQETVGDSTKGLVKQVNDNTSAIGVLNGDTAESVSGKIAAAINGLNLGDTYEAKGAANTVKNELTTEIGKKANSATTLAGYGITDAYTKTEVGAELDKKQNKLTAENLVGGDNVTVSIADGKITIAADKYDETTLKAAVDKNTSDITTINNSGVMKSGISADKVTTYDGYAAKIQANTDAAATAQSTANAAKTTAEAAIPAPAADKIGSNAKYVLTWDSTIGYQWEDISRTAE